MKVIIAGTRTFNDYELIKRELKPIENEITEVVSGTCRGPDIRGEQWALERHLPIKCFRPNWAKYGNSAGILRNSEEAKYSDFAIVFWDGLSRGTASLIREMESLKKPVLIIRVTSDKLIPPEE